MKGLTPDEARRDNRETVSSYETCADEYAESTRGEPYEAHAQMLDAFVADLAPGAHVLEIGSGPGWDADRLEARGVTAERTDVTQAFIELQRQRGKAIERLDVVNDEIPGRYDGIVCMYVLQHIARPLMDAVLAKLAAALRPGGVLLVALRQGSGEMREIGTQSGGAYHVTLWPKDEFIERLANAGLAVSRSRSFTGSDGEWLVVLARKADA
jgi:2-polyprenyl-3-methyl-5-hydroxy-6-metoxy-1,4-benzoquinol methylase